MHFIENADCKESVSNGSVNALSTSQNQKHIPTYVTFCCRLFPLQLN